MKINQDFQLSVHLEQVIRGQGLERTFLYFIQRTRYMK